MGMQCHFNLAELTESGNSHIYWEKQYDAESETWTLFAADAFSRLDVNLSGESCWFDIGSMSDTQMAAIKFLIRNRICFQCS